MKRSWYRILAMLAAIAGIAGVFFTPVRSDVQLPEETTEPAQQEQSDHSQQSLTFPHQLPDCDLVIEKTMPYSGAYMEDGTNDPVENVTALLVYNSGQRMVRFGAVALEQNGEQLYFFVYCLPPDSRCVVLEKNRRPYEQTPINQCRLLSIQWEYQRLQQEQVRYVGFGERLTVVNQTARKQKHITLWYKGYDYNTETYRGGIAYSTHVFRLNGGEQRELTPEQYHAGCAKVVNIQLDDS